MSTLLDIAVSLLPVLAFLIALIFLDSFKLLSARRVILTLAVGAVAAATAYLLNRQLFSWLHIDAVSFSQYIAPVVEELLKAVYLVWLIRTHRVGFLVDSAILGFAVGAGFSLVENAYYLTTTVDGNLFVWILRGFGTAAMHGGTTAIFAMLGKHLAVRWHDSPVAYLPGFVLAVLTHSLFNHFILPPLLTTVLLILFFTALVILVFERSERATRLWLGEGLDNDLQLWSIITSGKMVESRIGQYLESLTERFRPEVVADMLCYLQLHIELGVQAKGILLARDAGVKLAPDPEITAKLAELAYLEASMGKTGYLTIKPFVHHSRESIWQLQLLLR